MIMLNFGVHTRNWPRIDPQLLEFNLSFIFGDMGGAVTFLGTGVHVLFIFDF